MAIGEPGVWYSSGEVGLSKMSLSGFKRLCRSELEKAQANNEPPSRVQVLSEALRLAEDYENVFKQLMNI